MLIFNYFFVCFSFCIAGTGSSPAQNSTRSISPNIQTTNNNQFITSSHSLHNSSGNLGNITPTSSSSQQPVITYNNNHKNFK
jgi:hypothetical protein